MRILVIEDDPTVGQYVKRGLEEHRWAVDLVTDGLEGEQRASSEAYDLVILDMRLPTKSGTEVLHALRANGSQEPYYLGFFLMGAYQDIMGDLHNLFGRVNEVHVFLEPDEPTGYYIEEIIEGTTIIQALTSVQYDEKELQRQMKAQMDDAIKSDRMKPSEAMRLLDEYEKGLRDYTYLTI